jgi:hypothetical protein
MKAAIELAVRLTTQRAAARGGSAVSG